MFLGAGLGAAGGAIDAAQTRKQQARFRRRQRTAISDARTFAGGTTVQTGSFGGAAGFDLSNDQATLPGQVLGAGQDFEGSTFLDPTTGQRRAGGRVEEILADPILMQARQFLEGTFANAADSPLAQDFAKGIGAAQSSRGTFFGGAGISAEAGGLAAFSQSLRQDLLPQALQFGQLGEQLRQSVIGFEAPLRTAAATGGSGLGDSSQLIGPNVFGSALKGAISGGAAGFGLQQQFGGEASAAIDRLLGRGPQGPQLSQMQLDRISQGFRGIH